MLDSIFLFPLLFITGLAAGLVDSIAGGGGLITLPVLLGIGMPPHYALGTNKFQSSFGSFTASYYYVTKGGIDLQDAKLGIIYTFIGAAAGALAVQFVSGKILNYIIPFLLLGIIIYSFLTPKLGEVDRKPKFSQNNFYLIFGLLLGFYDGFFGPGTGTFWAIAFVAGLGFNLGKSTGYTKIMNFTSNIASFSLFIFGGKVIYLAGFSMAAGQIIGSKIGAGLVIKRGAKFIRPIFITVVILTTLKLIYDRLL